MEGHNNSIKAFFKHTGNSIKNLFTKHAHLSDFKGEPWMLTFAWNDEPNHVPPGGLFKDIWQLIMSNYIESSEDLTNFACSHPFFYTIVAHSSELQERAGSQTFSEALSTDDFVMTKKTCRLRPHHKQLGAGYAQDPAHNTAIIDVKRKASVHHPVQVDFLLRSDFKTKDYVSYFNFTVISGPPKKSQNAQMFFHYFVDGDLWECGYDGARRADAQWKEGDIISIQIGLVQRHAKDVIVQTPLRYPRTHKHDNPDGITKGAAVLLTTGLMHQGWVVYVALYKNQKMVYEPILLSMHAPVSLAYWVACKFAEYKDYVEIVSGPKLPPLVLEQQDNVMRFVAQSE